MALSLAMMYVTIFSMIDGWPDFRNNLNMLYMALTMVAPMGLIMLVIMGHMYKDRHVNTALYIGFALVFVAALAVTLANGHRRSQVLASMVPHHSGAILMCREASLTDPELVALCQQISKSQRSEIEQTNVIEKRRAGRKLAPRQSGCQKAAGTFDELCGCGCQCATQGDEIMCKVLSISAACFVAAVMPAYAQADKSTNWCTDAHMQQMDKKVSAMTDATKKKEANMHLMMSKDAMKAKDMQGCVKHMEDAHKAMGM